MRIHQSQLERAMSELGFTRDQSVLLWNKLESHPSVESRFEPAHVGYFFGALLVIGAMGWFITDGWDRFAGWQLTTITLIYAALFVFAGSRVWRTPMYRVAGGLLITMAVCMTPLVVYGLERQIHLWPQLDPGSYTQFHPLINASWVGMEVCTVLASLVALRYFKFPFLMAPAAYALWYMSMDFTGLIFGKSWSRVENRRSNCSLPVDMRLAFAASPQSGLTWSCFLFPLIEPGLAGFPHPALGKDSRARPRKTRGTVW
jgi:hypothetical protein